MYSSPHFFRGIGRGVSRFILNKINRGVRESNQILLVDTSLPSIRSSAFGAFQDMVHRRCLRVGNICVSPLVVATVCVVDKHDVRTRTPENRS